ncbi:Binding isoform, partial [Thalictrum thalictroides]
KNNVEINSYKSNTKRHLSSPIHSPADGMIIRLRYLLVYLLQRSLHSRNKKAMELIAKGWNALQEVDRVIDYTEPTDPRLHPLFRTAKENFELALEVDNSNTHARYWLGRLHMKYQCPGACKSIGAALLVEAADMGNPDAQYELGCRLRVEVTLVSIA